MSELHWTYKRTEVCTCGAWRMPYRWCDDDCAFIQSTRTTDLPIGTT